MPYFRIHYGIKGWLAENTDIIKEENMLKAEEIGREVIRQEFDFLFDFGFDVEEGYSWVEEITKEDLTDSEKRLETFCPVFDE